MKPLAFAIAMTACGVSSPTGFWAWADIALIGLLMLCGFGLLMRKTGDDE